MSGIVTPRPSQATERLLYAQGLSRIVGVDEAGRGSWAGPIVAAAVMLPKGVDLDGVRDSKLLTPRQREKLYMDITSCALAWSVGIVSVGQIDREGIGFANGRAIQQAVKRLSHPIEMTLIDGRFTWNVPNARGIVDGDATVLSIAAASIIAKVTRDRLMVALHERIPHYGFNANKGYGTQAHRIALQRHGLSRHHRRSFEPMRTMVRGAARER